MPHQCHPPSLRSRAKEDNPDILIFNVLDVLLYCTPRRLTDRAFIIVCRCEVNLTCHINLNLVMIADGNAWLLSWTVNACHHMSDLLKSGTNESLSYPKHFRAAESTSSSTFSVGVS